MKKTMIALLIAVMVVFLGPSVVCALDVEVETEYNLNTEISATAVTLETQLKQFSVELEYSNAFKPDDEITVTLGLDAGAIDLEYERELYSEEDCITITGTRTPFELEFEKALDGEDSGTITLTLGFSL